MYIPYFEIMELKSQPVDRYPFPVFCATVSHSRKIP